MQKKKLLLFDLDGTLIDSSKDLVTSVNYMLECLGKTPYADATVTKWIGNGAQTLVARALSGSFEIDPSLKKEEIEKALNIFLEHYKNNLCVDTKLYEGVAEGLAALHPHFTMAVITNKPFAFIEPIVKRLGIAAYFSLLLGADSLKEKKPSPLPLLYAMEYFGVRREQTLMVGDSQNDILAARQAGIESVLATYGYTQGKEPKKIGADIMIKDFRQLQKVLLG